MSARDDILKASQKCVPIEAFGGSYSIRVLTGRERDLVGTLCKTASEAKDFKGYREKLVALFLGDIAGVRVFTDNDGEVIAGLDSLELERVAHAGLKLNKLVSESVEESKKV